MVSSSNTVSIKIAMATAQMEPLTASAFGKQATGNGKSIQRLIFAKTSGSFRGISIWPTIHGTEGISIPTWMVDFYGKLIGKYTFGLPPTQVTNEGLVRDSLLIKMVHNPGGDC